MTRNLPIDDPAERAVLGACIIASSAIEAAAAIIEPGDFAVTRHAAIYAAIVELHRAGQAIDVLTVHRQTGREDVEVGYLHELQNATPSISNAHRHATAVADAKVRRDLAHAAADINQFATDGTSAADAADKARALLANIDMPAGIGAPDPDIDTFIASVDTAYDWLVPDFLERRDRMLVTAAEGTGKSLLLTQLAVQAAAGIHPWTHQACPPRNVLVVDLENSPRLVTRRLNMLRAQAGPGFNPQRLRVHTRSDGIDLTTRTDRRWLVDRCQANATELLVIGPAYRMYAGPAEKGDTGGEAQARTVTKALDDIRERFGVTLIMETHAPHAGAHGRDLRPFGSSVWLRWPEFGIGLAESPDNPRQYRLGHWRGPRDIRTWPTALCRAAGRWPWTPLMPTGTFRPPAAVQPAMSEDF